MYDGLLMKLVMEPEHIIDELTSEHKTLSHAVDEQRRPPVKTALQLARVPRRWVERACLRM